MLVSISAHWVVRKGNLYRMAPLVRISVRPLRTQGMLFVLPVW
jgi:hypothetical protein